MKTLVIFIIVSIISATFEHITKKNQKQQKRAKKTSLPVDKNVQEKPSRDNSLDILNHRTNKVIVDREDEIYSNSLEITDDKIVDDIIFAEILSKPKSKTR